MSRWRGRCGDRMTAALDLEGRFVDLRDPVLYSRWKSRPGLFCIVCQSSVHVHAAPRTGNIFAYHNSADVEGDGSSGSTASESFQHERLKFWVRDQVERLGATGVRTETSIGERIPDVSGRYNGHRFAVEVQWSSLSERQALERTSDLRTAGCDQVVWLCQPCKWTTRVPSLGIDDFDPADGNYEAFQGMHFVAGNELIGRSLRNYRLDEFLRKWLDGDVAWAYWRGDTGGWATVTDWTTHTKALLETNAKQHRIIQAQGAAIKGHREALGASKQRESDAEAVVDRHKTLAAQCTRELQVLRDKHQLADRNQRLREQILSGQVAGAQNKLERRTKILLWFAGVGWFIVVVIVGWAYFL